MKGRTGRIETVYAGKHDEGRVAKDAHEYFRGHAAHSADLPGCRKVGTIQV